MSPSFAGVKDGDTSRLSVVPPKRLQVFNKIALLLFAQPEVEAVVVTVDEVQKGKESGEYISHTEWHRCIVFGKFGEFSGSSKAAVSMA